MARGSELRATSYEVCNSTTTSTEDGVQQATETGQGRDTASNGPGEADAVRLRGTLQVDLGLIRVPSSGNDLRSARDSSKQVCPERPEPGSFSDCFPFDINSKFGQGLTH